MTITDFLAPEAVFELRATGKERVLRELSRRAAATLALDAETVAQAVLKREALGSTGLGNGVALPHARSGALEKPFGLFALLKPPVPFDAIDDLPVDLVFLLLLPEQPSAGLTAMACAARRLRDPAVVAKLRRARDAAALYATLTES